MKNMKIETAWQSDLRSRDFIDIEKKSKSLNLWAKDVIDLLKNAKPVARCANADDIQLYLKDEKWTRKNISAFQ
ncbi:hypothetical protein BGP_3901 [Beggiatoa sp. PS]|nr:hypothetical protein BGP_3901 [Beggiatoa sp. PS]